MKKTLLSIFFLLAIYSTGKAQSSAYNGGGMLNVGIGIGTPYLGSLYTSSIPVNPTISFEKGIANGISAGGELSYAGSKIYGINVNVIYVGARGSYHLGQIVDLSPKADLYGGLGIGYVVVNVNDGAGDSATASSGLGYGLYAGGKYYFAGSTAVYAEVGYQSLSYLNIGIAFKF